MFVFSLDRPISWVSVFGNDRAVEVEIGPGRGERVLAAAAGHPAVNFFAVELRAGAAGALSERAARLGIGNLRVVAGDVRWIFRLVGDASVAAYHIHFPDPWPKTRHRERRLATPTVACEIARTLAAGGAVHVASDLPSIVEGFARVLSGAELVRVPGAVPPERPKSSFEQRYARGGTAYACFVRAAREMGGSGSR